MAFNEEEIALAGQAGYFEAAGRYAANLLGLLQDLSEHGDPTAERAVLGAIAAPAVVLYGSQTKLFFAAGARQLAQEVPNGRASRRPSSRPDPADTSSAPRCMV